MKRNTDTQDIKAETLVSQLDIKTDFTVQTKGVFSRNYSEDLLGVEIEEDNATIDLSRDGIFHLLPQGLFFKENQLKEKSKSNFEFKKEYADFKKKKKEALSFFQPFDTAFFRLTLQLEQKLNNFAEIGNDFFENGYELQKNQHVEFETNTYISKIKILLPFASQIRGNLSLLIDILKNVLAVEKIEIKEIETFHSRFIIHKENLSKEEYLTMDKDLVPFFKFLCHWFLPIEKKYDYRIKDYKQPFILENSLILDYNTHL